MAIKALYHQELSGLSLTDASISIRVLQCLWKKLSLMLNTTPLSKDLLVSYIITNNYGNHSHQ